HEQLITRDDGDNFGSYVTMGCARYLREFSRAGRSAAQLRLLRCHLHASIKRAALDYLRVTQEGKFWLDRIEAARRATGGMHRGAPKGPQDRELVQVDRRRPLSQRPCISTQGKSYSTRFLCSSLCLCQDNCHDSCAEQMFGRRWTNPRKGSERLSQ